MRYTTLGASGPRVSEACLGTMTFGTDWGFGSDEETCRRQFELFAEAGGSFVDTANRYTNGTSEEMVGRFVRDDRERFVVATKYTLPMGDHPNAGGNSRRSLHTALEASLKRLGTDYVDVLWLHCWGRRSPSYAAGRRSSGCRPSTPWSAVTRRPTSSRWRTRWVSA